ncbi:MAG: hypothetical protein ACOYMA_03905 [Bacteroidia bacterium]
MKNNNKTKHNSSRNIGITIATIIAIFTFSSCSKDDPKQPLATNPQEVLTTILVQGFNQNDSLNINYQFAYKWEDLDGDGGNLPKIDTINLDSGIVYKCKIIILDKTKTPFDTVSNAIEEEKNAHQFFFSPSANLTEKINVEILDFDTNIPSLPVGLSFLLNTKNNQSFMLPIIGNLNVVLSHYDGVPKTKEKSSESDIDISFPMKLK